MHVWQAQAFTIAMCCQVYPQREWLTLHVLGDNINSDAAFAVVLPANALVVLHLELNWQSIIAPRPGVISSSVHEITH